LIREEESEDYGILSRRRVTRIPHLRGRKVLAWGAIWGSDGRGLNILLLEEAGALYGEWVMLLNKSGAFATVQTRPEPFAFAKSELEEEIPRVGSIHVFSSEVKPLDIGYLKEFIADYF